jgi:hypothetical protein
MVSNEHDPIGPLGTLRYVVASAARLANDLAADPLFGRLVDVFTRIPMEDRETILNVIEREVDLRNMSIEGHEGPLAGINPTKLNPNARLYFRVSEGDPPAFVPPEEIAQAMIRAARVMHRAFQRRDDLATVWEPAALEGLRRLEPAERETLRRLQRRLLELVDEADR